MVPQTGSTNTAAAEVLLGPALKWDDLDALSRVPTLFSIIRLLEHFHFQGN